MPLRVNEIKAEILCGSEVRLSGLWLRPGLNFLSGQMV